MRFVIISLFAICLYGLDFEHEYLDKNDFSVENGILHIKNITSNHKQVHFMESKTMHTKSNEILLDISSLDSNAKMRAYLPKKR